MDLLKVASKRSLWSEVVYISLNIGLALAILLVLVTTSSLWFAIGLALLSKWRIFAVRPRYWFAHLQSNLVDVIVTLSYVVLAYYATGDLLVQVILTALFVGWLLGLKPRSSRRSMTYQSGVALFVGINALAALSPDWDVFFVAIGFWLIGYGAARHVLVAYEESAHLILLSLLWGLVVAELGWITYYWTVAYQFTPSGSLAMAQVSVVALLISFVAERAYRSYHLHEKIRSNDILMPLLFSVSVILLLVVFFNAAPNSII